MINAQTNNAEILLAAEIENTKTILSHINDEIKKCTKDATVTKTVKGSDGQDYAMSTIMLDRLTPEQKTQFEVWKERQQKFQSKQYFIENYIKMLVPEAQNYSPVAPSFMNSAIFRADHAHLGNVDNKLTITAYSIVINGIDFQCPEKMNFEQYSQIYTQSLHKLLTRSLGQNLTPEQINQALQTAASNVLASQHKQVNPESFLR